MSKPKYDSGVARIAGNLMSGHPQAIGYDDVNLVLVRSAVATARAIVAEVQRTEPREEGVTP